MDFLYLQQNCILSSREELFAPGLGLPGLYIKTSVVGCASYSFGVSESHILLSTRCSVLLGLGSLSLQLHVRCCLSEELAGD